MMKATNNSNNNNDNGSISGNNSSSHSHTSSIFEDEDYQNDYSSSRTSSGTGDGFTNNTNSNNTKSSGNDEDEKVTNEAKMMIGSKMCVYLVLLLAAAAVSSVTYIILSNEQENTMVVKFTSFSGDILKQAQANTENMFEELWDLSKSITSHALDANVVWPNCTMPHFDVLTRQRNTKTEFVGFAPFVLPEEREGWEVYAVEHQDWIWNDYAYRGSPWNTTTPMRIPTQIHQYNQSQPMEQPMVFDDDQFNYEVPLWQVAPPRKDLSAINLDLATIPMLGHLLWDVKVKKVEQYSRILSFNTLRVLFGEEETMTTDQDDDHPRGTIYQPVFQDFREDAEVVGFVLGSLTWDKVFENVLAESTAPLLVEIEGTCNAVFTYEVVGGHAYFLGYGQQLRNPKFDKYKQSADLIAPLGSRPGYPPVNHTHRSTDAGHGESHCTYVMNTYPTAQFVAAYESAEPIVMTAVVAAVFLFTVLVFALYDFLVNYRQNKLMKSARATSALVASLFPKDVQKRLLADAKKQQQAPSGNNTATFRTKDRMNRFLHGTDDDGEMTQNNVISSAPIADLFPSATCFFGDLVGFTAWSSVREPSQVFILLETLYGAFDKIAIKRRVFKVETVGDCYVAVCGLPEKRKNHATIMARFARECLKAMKNCIVSLETTLGPETSSLGMRIGLHSGPVTAGVLRGDRARFQLFGDTVNTTSRIETTGQGGRIHISEQTADLLIAAGKEQWVVLRQDAVEAKGKGKLRTFWLVDGHEDGESSRYSASSVGSNSEAEFDDFVNSKHCARLVEWNVHVLTQLLKQIKAKRMFSHTKALKPLKLKKLEDDINMNTTMAFDEVQDVIDLPVVDEKTRQSFKDEAEKVTLDDGVLEELKMFVNSVASMYNNNAFHNFEHASHVTMAVCKLLSRIVEGSDEGANQNHAYGITSDPLTQFAVILSALIHDLDHYGVSNNQLIQECSPLATTYKGKSVAEQNSFHLAWNLLMEDGFSNLRSAIYCDEDEIRRFRQLLINAVLATDIMDKDLGAARKERWNTAFADDDTLSTVGEHEDKATNRKATIVIEHLIQASDVSHTMQHWHVYIKWNERLFREMYAAYQEGRLEKDPSIGWYKGELGFFDFYLIPLTQKLKDCQVFGVSSDEYLNYAQQNRAEWEKKGEEIVQGYLEKYCQEEFSDEEEEPLLDDDAEESIRTIDVANNQSSKQLMEVCEKEGGHDTMDISVSQIPPMFASDAGAGPRTSYVGYLRRGGY